MKTRSKKSLLCANCSSWISVGLCHSCDHKSIKEIFWQIKHLGFIFRMYSNGVLNINKYHKKVINGLLLFKLSVNFFVDSVADAKWLFWHILWVYSSSLRSLFSAIFLHITQRPFDVTYSLSAFPFQYQNKKTRIAVLVTRTQINCLTFDQIFQPVDPILQLNLDMDSGYTPNMKRFIRKVSHFRCPNITN